MNGIDLNDEGNFGGRVVLILGILTLMGYIFMGIVFLKEKGVFKSMYFKIFIYGIIFGICSEIGKGLYLGLTN